MATTGPPRSGVDERTVRAGEMLLAIAEWVAFEAVTLRFVPLVFSVTLKFFVPATNGAFVGKMAAVSEDRIRIVSLVLITFQLASTPLTIAVNGTFITCASGAPVLPLAVPGDEDSPGSKSWSFVNTPA